MRHRFGIRKKIMLTMAFMTIIPVLVMGIVSTAQSRNIIKEQTNTLARKNLIITAQEINEKVDLLYATIQELPTNTVVLSGLRRLPDTSEAHLSYREQLETELYSARNLLRLKGAMMGKILRIGIPSAMENSFFQLGRVVVVSMIALFGTTHTSANAVANTLDSIGIITGQAVGLAMITVVGQCVGAHDTDQAVYYIKKLMLWTYSVMGVAHTLVLIFVKQLVGLYSSLSPETAQLATTLVQIHSVAAIILWPAAFTLPNALRAANDVKFTMIVSIASMILWRVSFSYILCVNMQLGAIGVWIAMIIDWVCRTSFFVGRVLSGKWKTKYTD